MSEVTFSQASMNPRERLATTRMIRSILILEIIGVAGLAISDELTYHILRTAYAAAPLVVILLVCLLLIQRGILLPAQILVPVGPLLVRDYLAFEGVGIHDVSLIVFPIVIVLAFLTLDRISALVVSGLVILSTSIITIMGGATPTANLDDAVTIAILLAATVIIIYIIVGRLNENIQRAYLNEQAQIKTNIALEEERANLETRVKERTQALEHRAVQLRTAAEVGNVAASIRDLDSLLHQTVRLLSNRFGFYHAGIFLLDETEEFAVLRAANSEGGQRMLHRNHKLEVGRVGIVGYVAKTSEARIALDVGQDAVFFNNPDLPDTRSEMSLPLNVAGRVLGVLDIQSTQSQAFTKEDIEIMRVVADQLAIAIENSRLLAESQAAIEATRRAYGEIAVEAWKQLLETEPNLGFVSTGRETRPLVLARDDVSPEASEAVFQSHPVTSADQVKLFAPISVRGQSIGTLRLVKPNQERWTENEIQIVQSLSDQLSGALEGARLFDEAQRQAAKEQIIGEITSKISASINMRNVLRTAAEELGRAIPGSEVVIQFQSGNEIEKQEK